MLCYFLNMLWILVFLLILNINLTLLAITNDSNHNIVLYKGFIDVLKALGLPDQYPDVLKNGTCYGFDGISVRKNQDNKISIVVTLNINDTNGSKEKFCTDKKSDIQLSDINGNSTTTVHDPNKDHASILAISQTIGIIICALLLGLFFFIAGIMRLKNFLRRNGNNFKLSGLRSCLTNADESQKWRPSVPQDFNQSTISSYLQLQSAIDKNVSQFMVRSNHYPKSTDQEIKRPNTSVKRKLSLKNKLLPKRLNNHQNTQRRYSLTNEIESVMNKHFNMIGVTRKYGSKSTHNIGGSLIPQSNRLSQHSMLNEMNFSFVSKDMTTNNVNDSSTINSKSVLSRYHRNGNFPGRRATTIGARSSNSRQKPLQKSTERDSPPPNTIYSSHHSVAVVPQSTHGNVLKKQLTLQEGTESQIFDKADNEACYLKVPFKSLNLLSNKKCIFHINDEKVSPSPESRESNSRCSSFDKASCIWNSLEVQEDFESKHNIK